jgi:hypothetical protein
MPITIRETTITPGAGHDVVQLHISDAPPDDESATLRLVLLAKIPSYQAPALGQLQRAAMKKAHDVLMALLPELAAELKKANVPVDPTPKRPDRHEDQGWEGPDEN